MSRSIDHLAVSAIGSMERGAIVGSGCLNGSHLINIAIGRSHVCYWCAIHRKIAFLDARHGACSSAMSTEKRITLMKKGACFICEKPGHMARDHDEYVKKIGRAHV